MPPAVFLTWLQLRGLAWSGTDTPSLCLQDLVELTGKSKVTLTRHLDHLQLMHALRWHSTEPGKIIVTFPKKIKSMRETAEPNFQNCNIANSKMPPSLNHAVNSDSHQIPVLEPEIQESIKNPEDEVEGAGEGECEGESLQSSPVVSSRFHDAFTGAFHNVQTLKRSNVLTSTDVYRSLAHLNPNPAQRRILSSKITDLPLWQQTLEHWLEHGWNPKNLLGMLELYARGGPSGCRFCYRDRSPKGGETALEHTLAAIETLRRKQGQPPESE